MRRLIDDLLWLLSFGATVGFWKSLYLGVQHGTDGFNISWLFLGLIFLVINAWLQVQSLGKTKEIVNRKERKDKQRIVWQALSIYAVATTFNVVVITSFFLNGGSFSLIDLWTVLLVSLGSSLIWKHHKIDPWSKEAIGKHAGVFKGIPQIFLAIAIIVAYLRNHSAKMAVTWQANIWQHAIGVCRLTQVVISYYRNPDAPTKASLVSEVFNEISLTVVSLAMAYVSYCHYIQGIQH